MLAADPFRAELLAAVGPDPGSPRMLA